MIRMTAKMRRQVFIAISLAALAVAIAAQPAAAATARVEVGDYFFKKRSITIDRLDRVRWAWVGRDLHDVTVTRGPRKFHSSTKRRGSYTKRFRKRGTYRYICTVHPIDMRGKVVVD
jgi:plastocyanin